MISPQQIETLQWVDTIIRVIGWPALFTAAIWAIRKWDAGQREFRDLHENTKLAAETVQQVKVEVDTIKNNHLAHLQSGIEAVADSNQKAVDYLQEISTNIRILSDRVPRDPRA